MADFISAVIVFAIACAISASFIIADIRKERRNDGKH